MAKKSLSFANVQTSIASDALATNAPLDVPKTADKVFADVAYAPVT